MPSHTADVIYALDMFHMVRNTLVFLTELFRLVKPYGVLFLEDGHQSRNLSKEKVNKSACWKIAEETKEFLKCHPKVDIGRCSLLLYTLVHISF